MSVVCDGASDNWRMFTLQDIGDNMVYKIPKLYSKSKKPIFFISDPCHLSLCQPFVSQLQIYYWSEESCISQNNTHQDIPQKRN